MNVRTFTIHSKYSSTTFTNLSIDAPCSYSSTHPKAIFFNAVTQSNLDTIATYLQQPEFDPNYYMTTKANTNTTPLLYAIATFKYTHHKNRCCTNHVPIRLIDYSLKGSDGLTPIL